MKLQIVHDRTATGVIRLFGAAAVIRCGNRVEKLPHCYFSWIVSFQNRGQKCPMQITPPFESPGWGFLDEISHGRLYGKKNTRQVDRRTDQRTGRRTDRHTRRTRKDGQIDIQTDGLSIMNIRTDIQTKRRTDRHTNRQQTDRSKKP